MPFGSVFSRFEVFEEALEQRPISWRLYGPKSSVLSSKMQRLPFGESFWRNTTPAELRSFPSQGVAENTHSVLTYSTKTLLFMQQKIRQIDRAH